MYPTHELKAEVRDLLNQTNDDYTLNRVHFVLNEKPVIELARQLFRSKSLPDEGEDFKWFVSDFLMNLSLSVPKKIGLIEDMIHGEIFDHAGFLTESEKAVVNIQDFFRRPIDSDSFHAIMSHKPRTWSNNDTGKGEYMMVLLCNATKMAVKGDIAFDGIPYELKGYRAQLRSQTTHAAPNGLKGQILADLRRLCKVRKPDSIPVFNIKNFRDFYDVLFRDNGLTDDEYAGWLARSFARLMVFKSTKDFDWIRGCIRDGILDPLALRWGIVKTEFEYYQDHENFEAVIFLNSRTHNALTVTNKDTMDQHKEWFKAELNLNWGQEKNKATCLSLLGTDEVERLRARAMRRLSLAA